MVKSGINGPTIIAKIVAFFFFRLWFFIILAELRRSVKGVATGGAHFRGLAPEQHSSEETSQQWRAVGKIVSDLNRPGSRTQTSRFNSDVFNHPVSGFVSSIKCIALSISGEFCLQQMQLNFEYCLALCKHLRRFFATVVENEPRTVSLLASSS